ncbi:hypothetical protein MiSe_94310 [Microseira wollei NIES-4236]|uniref:Uncharacterized protein n=1 Tax=Microseira wollei NIES-4236 TaxID=2530354 RepID=A0AAV3XRC1_9CYAN|nr:hypothetical protein MiSe_94310 [Microseira wollei NIES-4236]
MRLTVGTVREKSSIANPWSNPASLTSSQRIQSVSPFAQLVLIVPPLPLTLPAALPSTVTLLLFTGDVQSKLLPGAVQETAIKLLPKPYCSTMFCGVVFAARHCSPLKDMLRAVIVVPVLLVAAKAIQPAIAPPAGLPK